MRRRPPSPHPPPVLVPGGPPGIRPEYRAESLSLNQGMADMMDTVAEPPRLCAVRSMPQAVVAAPLRPAPPTPQPPSQRTSSSRTSKVLTSAKAAMGSAMQPSAFTASHRTCDLLCDSKRIRTGTAGFPMETNSFRAFVRITALESARSATRDEIRASRLLICPVVLCLVGGTVFPSVCRKNITKNIDCVVAFDGKLPPSLLAHNNTASFALMRNYLDFIVNVQNTSLRDSFSMFLHRQGWRCTG